MSAELEMGRDAYQRQSWADARSHLLEADRASPLAPEDLELLAISCFLVGRDRECDEVTQRGHKAYLAAGNDEGAVRAGLSLVMRLFNSGEYARAAGWLARCKRILEQGGADNVQGGYILVPQALQSLFAGEVEQALALFQEAARVAERFGDPDLLAMGRMGQGRTLINLGQISDGVAILDELMVSVTSGEVSPMVSGIVYCATIEACQEIFDLRRAHEWTSALDRWCESQPGLVTYRGSCSIFRAHLMQLHGEWSEAMSEAERARERMLKPSIQPGAGDALYELAEIHRLRGDFAKAEAAYREGTQLGRSAQPGLALIRVAQGQVAPAAAAVRRELDGAHERPARCRLLPAFVEISIASGDLDAAQLAAEELALVASELGVPWPRALALRARGSLQLARGEHGSALESLRESENLWREVGAPYEGARTRVLIGLACSRLGDAESAELELEAARHVFASLGAATDLKAVEALLHPAPAATAGGLSAREVQVLRLVAAGKTNRMIASELFISEKTVARHVSNIFTKLGLSSRAAATAYAYEHGLN